MSSRRRREDTRWRRAGAWLSRVGFGLVVLLLAAGMVACGGGDENNGNNGNNGTDQQVAAPSFSPTPGQYDTPQTVTISTTTTGATIYYTTDGSDPTTTSLEYTGQIAVENDKTFKAFAVKEGLEDSDVTTASYVIGEEDLDTDGDGLSDEEEAELGTSPTLSDTDGDGLSDGREVSELGFDPDNDPYKFNPLVADVPKLEIELATAPVISLDMESSQTSSTEVTTGTEQSYSETVTTTDTTTHSTSIERSVSESRRSVGIGPIKIPEPVSRTSYEKSTTEEESFSWSESQSSTNSQAFSQAQAIREERGFTYNGGEINVAVNLENAGNLSFTITNATLSAIEARPADEDVLYPIGNLDLDSQWSQFPETTLGPGETVENLIFTKEDLDLSTAMSLWRDSRGMVVKPATYELTDANGVSFDHNLTDIRARTANVIVDYGPSSSREPEHFMVATNIDQSDPGVLVGDVMSNVLRLPYTSSNAGLSAVRDVEAGDDSEWIVAHFYSEAGEDAFDIYSAEGGDYDFDGLELKSGSVLQLIYMDDSDADALYAREEFLYGTDMADADTDGDGLLDGEEVGGVSVTGVTRGEALVSTNPVDADTDDDGSEDKDEVDAGDDPTSRFPLRMDVNGDRDDEIRDVAVDDDGNVYAVGQSAAAFNYWQYGAWQVRKFSADGQPDVDWDMQLDGTFPDGEDAANAVAIGPDGSVFIAGFFSQLFSNQPEWEQDWQIKRYSPAGQADPNWNISLDSDEHRGVTDVMNDDRALAIDVDASGNVYVAGYAENLVSGSSGLDWWVVKIGPDGQLVNGWDKRVDYGGGEDKATAVAVDSSGNVYVAGYNTDTEGSSGADWRIIKWTSTGDKSWDKTLAHSERSDKPHDLLVHDGHVYVAGYYYRGSQTGRDWLVDKFTTAGDDVAEWDVVFSGQTTSSDEAYAIEVGPWGYIYVVGYVTGQYDHDWRIHRYAPDGTLDTDWRFGVSPDSQRSDEARGIGISPRGEVYVGGYVAEGVMSDTNDSEWYVGKYYAADKVE